MDENDMRARQTLALRVLRNGGSLNDAARGAGVARETLARWMKQPEFTAALNAPEAIAPEDADLAARIMEELREIARRIADGRATIFDGQRCAELTTALQALRAVASASETDSTGEG